MFHTLLLNHNYVSISFITERKALKLLAKEKVDVESFWDEKVFHGRTGSFQYPAVLRLKHQVRWIPRKMRFNRVGVFRRDQYICQYCGHALTPSKLTLDHVKPRAHGGDSSWMNCVTSCFECNNKKGDRTPAEAGMKLLSQPKVPLLTIASEARLLKKQHISWQDYIPELKNNP